MGVRAPPGDVLCSDRADVFVVPLFSTGYHEWCPGDLRDAVSSSARSGTLAYVIAARFADGIRPDQHRGHGGALRASGGAPDQSAAPWTASHPASRSRTRLHVHGRGRGRALRSRAAIGGVSGPARSFFITGGNGSGNPTMLRAAHGLYPARGRPPAGRWRTRGCGADAGIPRPDLGRCSPTITCRGAFYGSPMRTRPVGGPLLARLEMEDKVGVRDGAFTTVDLSAGQRKRLALVVALLEEKAGDRARRVGRRPGSPFPPRLL